MEPGTQVEEGSEIRITAVECPDKAPTCDRRLPGRRARKVNPARTYRKRPRIRKTSRNMISARSAGSRGKGIAIPNAHGSIEKLRRLRDEAGGPEGLERASNVKAT